MVKRKTAKKRSSDYIDKDELLAEVAKAQKTDEVSEELASMFIKIVDGVCHKFHNLQYYGITDDVKQDCLVLLLQKYKNFDITRKTSCFAYITTCVFNQIRYQLGKAKKYNDGREKVRKRVKDFYESSNNLHFNVDDKGDED